MNHQVKISQKFFKRTNRNLKADQKVKTMILLKIRVFLMELFLSKDNIFKDYILNV
jgi:hypothetical protein